MKKLKSILKKGNIKWYQVLIIGFLAGIIPPIFKYGSDSFLDILVGLFIFFFIYNIWIGNRKKKKIKGDE